MRLKAKCVFDDIVSATHILNIFWQAPAFQFMDAPVSGKLCLYIRITKRRHHIGMIKTL